MDPDRVPVSDLDGWARERAPAVLAEAEREAVRVLRDVLVDAAVRARTDHVPVTPERSAAIRAEPGPLAEPAPGAKPTVADEQPLSGELWWAYCVLHGTDAASVGGPGVHPSGDVEGIQAAGLVALVSRVPRAEFAAKPLHRNLNELEWLERVARAHEAVLEAALEEATIVPLRMCTLYESPDSVRDMLIRERDALIDSLAALDGRVEWGVKLTVDRERLLEGARSASGSPADDEDTPGRSEGGAYMLRRRRDREVRELAASWAGDIAQEVHARLQDWAIDAVSRPPQNAELSGHEGQMLLNAAYLVDRGRTDELRQIVGELEQHHRDLGARIELSGPWPPYNFVSTPPSP